MIMFVWLCVMTQAFIPGAERAFSLHAAAIDAQVRAHMEWQEDELKIVPLGTRRSVAMLEHYRNQHQLAA